MNVELEVKQVPSGEKTLEELELELYRTELLLKIAKAKSELAQLGA